MSTEDQSLYELLGVSNLADTHEIGMAFRRAAKRWHPDLNATHAAEATERMKHISAAYDVLRDPNRRAVYDRSLHSTPEPAEQDGGGDRQSSPMWWKPGAAVAEAVGDAGAPPGYLAAPGRGCCALSLLGLAACPPLGFLLMAWRERERERVMARWAVLYAFGGLIWSCGAGVGSAPVDLVGRALWLVGVVHCVRWRRRLSSALDDGKPRGGRR
jgi:DnaJ domain